MFTEEDLLPISALQHLAFCERQWGLIHLEGLWEDNRLTVEGSLLHERVHSSGVVRVRAGVRVVRGLPLRSLRLGISGVADVVEFHRYDGEGDSALLNEIFSEASSLAPPPADHPSDAAYGPAASESPPHRWRPFPVEYKRGSPKLGPWDEIQLCAQALCLEEMLDEKVPEGDIFYGRPRRRCRVLFDSELRAKTERLCARLHALQRKGHTPPAEYAKKCRSCSLIDSCMPRATGGTRSAKGYLLRNIRQAVQALPGELE